MRLLLDTNILIHREASRIVDESIAQLYQLLERHHFDKLVHQVSVDEISRLEDPDTRKTMQIKLGSYQKMATQAPISPNVQRIIDTEDQKPNSVNDSILLNELVQGRVDAFVTEDRGVHRKAQRLGVSTNTYTIEALIEKILREHPDFINYPVPTVTKEFFGNIDVNQPFFDSLKGDYKGFTEWFSRKADATAYISRVNKELKAFLYLKVEGKDESYADIEPTPRPAKRLKIGTFKVACNGFRIGERFVKIIIDNAIEQRVEQIYVTIFNKSFEKLRLIELLKDFGFSRYGKKTSTSGEEQVFVKEMNIAADPKTPKKTYPFISMNARSFIVPIYPEYHTSLFPDSILSNESPMNFVEQQPFRNAIRKAYISRSYYKDLNSGDSIVFYRTGGYHRSVVTTIGIVDRVIKNLTSFEDFAKHCQKRSVFSDDELRERWNHRQNDRPFIVHFLYAFSLKRRPNMKRLIELGIIGGVDQAPRGFEEIPRKHFTLILREGELEPSSVIH